MGSGLREVFKESVSAVTDTASADVTVGTIRYEGDEVYSYVYNGGGEQVAPGYAVIASGASGHTVTITSVTGLSVAYGVVKHATITTAAYGWVLKRGTGRAIGASNASWAAGNGLALGAAGMFVSATFLSGVGYLNIPAVAVSAVATGGSGLALFNCI